MATVEKLGRPGPELCNVTPCACPKQDVRECWHERQSIQGVLLQNSTDGAWHAVFARAGDLVAITVRFCPFCGCELWGLPRRA